MMRRVEVSPMILRGDGWDVGFLGLFGSGVVLGWSVYVLKIHRLQGLWSESYTVVT